jgi:hypothetical protein
MAQAAEKRGLATDPDVVEDTRAALVSQFVAKEFEDKYTRKEDFGDDWDDIVKRAMPAYKHPEYRASTYVRIPVPEKAPPDQDAAAHALADKIAAAASSERGMLSSHFLAIATRAAEGHPIVLSSAENKPQGWIEYADVQLLTHDALVESYADALWAIPEIGRTSPAVRTKWGWDVILFSDVVPGLDTSAAELERKLLPDVKRAFFIRWTQELKKQLGARYKVFKENVPLLEKEVL